MTSKEKEAVEKRERTEVEEAEKQKKKELAEALRRSKALKQLQANQWKREEMETYKENVRLAREAEQTTGEESSRSSEESCRPPDPEPDPEPDPVMVPTATKDAAMPPLSGPAEADAAPDSKTPQLSTVQDTTVPVASEPAIRPESPIVTIVTLSPPEPSSEPVPEVPPNTPGTPGNVRVEVQAVQPTQVELSSAIFLLIDQLKKMQDVQQQMKQTQDDHFVSLTDRLFNRLDDLAPKKGRGSKPSTPTRKKRSSSPLVATLATEVPEDNKDLGSSLLSPVSRKWKKKSHHHHHKSGLKKGNKKPSAGHKEKKVVICEEGVDMEEKEDKNDLLTNIMERFGTSTDAPSSDVPRPSPTNTDPPPTVCNLYAFSFWLLGFFSCFLFSPDHRPLGRGLLFFAPLWVKRPGA